MNFTSTCGHEGTAKKMQHLEDSMNLLTIRGFHRENTTRAFPWVTGMLREDSNERLSSRTSNCSALFGAN